MEFRWGERTYIMGVLNLSPDSFSGDGLGSNLEAIVNRARTLVEEGADILDVGGESTRPGAEPLSVDEELSRVIPAIERLSGDVPVPLSIDTYKSEVASRALEAGADMINDIRGLRHDKKLAQVAGKAGVPVVLVSNQRGCSHTGDIMEEVVSSLRASIGLAVEAGVDESKIIVDPGIGFGKGHDRNLEVVRRLAELRVLGRPVLLGASRKFMAGSAQGWGMGATAATIAIGITMGVDMVRVHDVREMAAVCRMSDALVRGGK
jgi:dihydropteroate synthase